MDTLVEWLLFLALIGGVLVVITLYFCLLHVLSLAGDVVATRFRWRPSFGWRPSFDVGEVLFVAIMGPAFLLMGGAFGWMAITGTGSTRWCGVAYSVVFLLCCLSAWLDRQWPLSG